MLEHTTGIDQTHVGVMFTHVSLPLFYCLSGYFWKSDTSAAMFFKGKINSLLIPALFFLGRACLVYYCLQLIGVHFVIPFRFGYIFDIFRPTEEIYCNGVVWFLISLFWLNCFFYFVSSVVQGKMFYFVLIISSLCGVFWIK